MNIRAEVHDFLTSRRAKITPEQAGIPAAGQRRVPGLRRSEVAALAGMSVEYYAKLERGQIAGVSAGVLEAIARTLQLDDAERAHLLHLAQEANGSTGLVRRPGKPKPWTVRPSLQWSLDTVTAPAIVVNHRQDLLAANLLGRAMYSDVYDTAIGTPNFGRFTFLDNGARRFYPDWNLAADMLVANLRTAAGVDPHDKACTTWSANCPPAATSSAAAGAPTTCACTAPASRRSTTTSSATSSWRTKPWPWSPSQASV